MTTELQDRAAKIYVKEECFVCTDRSQYVCINFGVLICPRCALIFRRFNYIIKSIVLSSLSKEEIEIINTTNLDNKFPNHLKPNCTDDERKQFIVQFRGELLSSKASKVNNISDHKMKSSEDKSFCFSGIAARENRDLVSMYIPKKDISNELLADSEYYVESSRHEQINETLNTQFVSSNDRSPVPHGEAINTNLKLFDKSLSTKSSPVSDTISEDISWTKSDNLNIPDIFINFKDIKPIPQRSFKEEVKFSENPTKWDIPRKDTSPDVYPRPSLGEHTLGDYEYALLLQREEELLNEQRNSK